MDENAHIFVLEVDHTAAAYVKEFRSCPFDSSAICFSISLINTKLSRGFVGIGLVTFPLFVRTLSNY